MFRSSTHTLNGFTFGIQLYDYRNENFAYVYVQMRQVSLLYTQLNVKTDFHISTLPLSYHV